MSRPVRITILVACGVLIAAAAVLAAIYTASRHVPAFYREALNDDPPARKKAAEHMLRQATTLQNDLKREGTWQTVFTAADLNGWLAVELPRNASPTLPPGFHDPRVRIDPTGISVACQVDRGGLHGVVSLDFDVYMEKPAVVGLRIRRVRVGAIPWSQDRVLKAISDAAQQAELQIQWRQAEGDPVALVSLPPTSHRGRTVRIDNVQIEDGAIRISGATVR